MIDLSKQHVRESDVAYILDIGEFATMTILRYNMYNVILQTMLSY